MSCESHFKGRAPAPASPCLYMERVKGKAMCRNGSYRTAAALRPGKPNSRACYTKPAESLKIRMLFPERVVEFDVLQTRKPVHSCLCAQ